MTGTDDQQPAWPAGDPTTGDLAAMVRVLEQRCREAEGQAGLAEEGRHRSSSCSHQQQVQTDSNAHGRQQAEDAYQQVRSSMARATAELQHTGGAEAEALAASLLALVGGDPEAAPTWPPPPVPPQVATGLSSQLVRLVRLAGATRSRQRRERVIRGLCVVATVLVVSLVFGRVGARTVEVAGVQVAAPAPMVATADTREADAAWASLAPQLDSTRERDWAATIRLLDGFLQHWPTYAVAQDKLYAALVADAQVKLQAGQAGDGVAEVERAARLLPERAGGLGAAGSAGHLGKP